MAPQNNIKPGALAVVIVHGRVAGPCSTTGSSALRYDLVSSPACSRRAGRCRRWIFTLRNGLEE